MLKRLNSSKLIYIAILASILAGCGTTPVQQKPETAVISMENAPNDASFYLQQAKIASTANEKASYQLLATEAFFNINDIDAAQNTLQALLFSTLNNNELRAKHIYLTSKVIEQTRGLEEALFHLKYPSTWVLADCQLSQYYSYKAELLGLMKQPLKQAKQLTLLGQYIDASQTQLINDQIWSILQRLDEDTLRKVMQSGDNPTYSGWLQLAFIAKHYAVDPGQLVSYLAKWQQQNPNHPGATRLPTHLEGALNSTPYKPSRIAILLPLSGARAKVASAVKQGILASYMTKGDDDVQLRFIDSNLGITQAYSQAQMSNADFIIGPLLQSEVEALQNVDAMTDSVIPQLFLNQATNLRPHIDRFYFSLSPAQEAADAARRLALDGIETPLVLASNNGTGRRMAMSFNKAWQAQNSSNAEIHYYDAGDKMKQTVQQALGVTDSLERINRVKALLGTKVVADFRSRRDIDAIYMISGKQDLLLLKPFIDVNFSVFANPVPLYASSRSRIEGNSAQAMQELNNLTISDIPWLLQQNEETRLVKSLWPTWSNNQKRLFIMGFDSLNLVNKLSQMRAFPGYQFQGRSGTLSVSPDGEIERKLSWAKYRRGKLRKL